MLAIFKKRRNPFYIFTTVIIIILAALTSSVFALLLSIILVIVTLFHPFFLDLFVKIYGIHDIADRVFYARTNDGWNIALHYHKAVHPKEDHAPVIVVHGIATNKFVVDLDKHHSLPYYLKLQGYDVYSVSLRGCGRSYHESPSRYEDFSFDDIVKYDVPAIIEKVKSLSHSPKVNWVGHSMGAIIMYAYMGVSSKEEKESIASFVSLGGPGTLNHLGHTLISLLSRFPNARKMLDLKFGAAIITPMAGEIYTPIDEVLYNPEVTGKATIKKIMKNAVENISAGLTDQFMHWIEQKKMTSMDSRFDYMELQKEISVPVLFIAGKNDGLATPESLKFVYQNCSSKIKEFLVISKANGYTGDYGHACLVMGEKASEDVFPIVEKFIYNHGTRKKKSIFKRFKDRVFNWKESA
ncbi:MAG: alpha/beta fold hydrolase [Leptospiraceae bacterium]|nr:alpha/beta fold hydrolase [Leptospiraceae bacterium]